MDEQNSQNTPQPRRRPLALRILRFVLFSLLILLLLLVGGASGIYVWLGTENGLAFVQKQVNAQAEPMLAANGLCVKLKHLQGSLPNNFVADLDLADRHGDFLHLPETRFALGLGLFPPQVEISQLRLNNAVLARMPILPPSEPEKEENTEPMTPGKLRELLRTAADPVFSLPESMPAIHIKDLGVENFSLPKELCGFPVKVTVLCEIGLTRESGIPKLRVALPRLSLEAQDLGLSGTFAWESGRERGNWLAGELAVDLSAKVRTQAFLAQAESSAEQAENGTARLGLHLQGPLFAPNVKLDLGVKQLALSGQNLSDLALQLQARPLDLVGLLAADVKKPLSLHLNVAGKCNQEPLAMHVDLNAALSSEERFDDLIVSLKQIVLKALGLEAQGHLQARLGQGLPKLEGDLRAAISDWHAVEAFLPGQKLAGSLAAELALRESKGQDLTLSLDIPKFSLTQAQADPLSLANLQVRLGVHDLFTKRELLATVVAESIALGQQKLGCRAEAKGTLQDLALTFKSTGAVEADLALGYRPDRVDMSRLALSANTRAFTGKDEHIGLRLRKPVSVHFGPDGLSVGELDLNLQPKGQIEARGSLTPSNYRFQLAVKDVDLSVWQRLIKDLPKGMVQMHAQLAGSATQPRGNIKLAVTRLEVPRVRLHPLDLTLLGDLSAKGLQVRLEMPKQTIQALGGEKMGVGLTVPLTFTDGVPALAEHGSLKGEVLWQGKLAPLWKLSPLSDRKLSGDLHMDVKIAGTPKAPVISGGVEVGKGRFEDPILGVLLRDIGLKVAVQGKNSDKGLAGQVKITGGLGDGMGGKLSLDGTAGLDGEQFRVQTKLDHLRPLRREDVRISLSGDILAQGKPSAPDIGGVIVVDSGAVQLENIAQGPKGVTTLPIKEKTVAKPVSVQAANDDSGRLHIAIRSPGRFLVDGFGLSTEWKTDLAIQGTPANPVISGEVSAVKGELYLLNKNFALEKGEIFLGGGNVANPLLDILLTNTTADFTSHVRISGTVKKMKLSLTSEPEMPQDDVLAHILFGRNANELGRYEALQLAAATARMASGLGSGLNNPRKALGLDVMRLKSDSRSSDNSGFGSMAVESGKYLTDSIYVGVEQGAGEGSTAGTVQLEITPKLKLELRSQGTNTQGNLNWKHNY